MEPLQGQANKSAMKVSAIELEGLLEVKKQILWAIIETCGKDLSEEQKRLLIAYQ